MEKYKKITRRIRRFISPISFFFAMAWGLSFIGGGVLLLLNLMMWDKGGPPLLLKEAAIAFVVGGVLSPLVESDRDLTPEQKERTAYRQKLLRELDE